MSSAEVWYMLGTIRMLTVTKARPMTNMPQSEMTTVVPAKSTARPAVLMAVDVASSLDRPLWRPSR